jgi:hypothetical protein
LSAWPAPLAVNLGQPVDDSGGAFFVEQRIVEGVEGTPRPRVEEVLQPFPNRGLASLLDGCSGNPCVLDRLDGLGHFLFHGFDVRDVALAGFFLAVAQGFSHRGHFFEIRSHSLLLSKHKRHAQGAQRAACEVS